MSSMRTASSPERIVIDASVSVKWYLRNEDLASESSVLLDDFDADRVSLVAPGHFPIEVGNALRNAVRPGRLTVPSAHQALATFTALAIRIVPLDELLILGFQVALRYDCALYDALYLALADELGCPFVHADRRLRNTLASRFEHELWIEDYAAGRGA